MCVADDPLVRDNLASPRFLEADPNILYNLRLTVDPGFQRLVGDEGAGTARGCGNRIELAQRFGRQADIQDGFGCHRCKLVYDRRLRNITVRTTKSDSPHRFSLPPASAIPPAMSQHGIFIVAAYAVAVVALGGLWLASVIGRRRARREIAARGLERAKR